MDWIFDPHAWIALSTLTAFELVLGVDNIVFIAILVGKLPPHQRAKARSIGILLAAITRIGLLLSIVWIMRLTTPLFTLFGEAFSGRDLILIAGGLFLLAKSTFEIHEKLEGEDGRGSARIRSSFVGVVAQISVLDIVFSLDSVITAVGMVNQVEVMITAILIAVAFMLWSAGAIGDFIDRHPTIKMLALSFLLLIGVGLVAEGFDFHIPKGYLYFAMGFSVFVEFLNFRLRQAKQGPIQLRQSYRKTPVNPPTQE